MPTMTNAYARSRAEGVPMIRAIRKWWWMAFEEHMPDELRQATLMMSETPVWWNHPIPLYGTPDQVYRLEDNRFVVVDTKTRLRMYPRDIVQLSAYRLLLAGRSGLRPWEPRPADHAYVRCDRNGVRYQRVGLLSARDLIALWGFHHCRRMGSRAAPPLSLVALMR